MIESQDFIDWLEFLKKNLGLSNNEVAKAAGISQSRVKSLKVGRTVIKPDDFRKLVIAFPVLSERAKELGIDYYPTAPDQVMHLSEPQANELGAAMLEDIRKAVADKDAQIEHLQAENLRLHGIIDHLMGKTSA